MKKYILIALVALVGLSSCSTSRSGCNATSGFMGYR